MTTCKIHSWSNFKFIEYTLLVQSYFESWKVEFKYVIMNLWEIQWPKKSSRDQESYSRVQLVLCWAAFLVGASDKLADLIFW